MIQLYVTPSCLSCRKARAWLEENGLAYEEHNLFSDSLGINELKGMLQLTEEGTSELISVRSKAFQELNVDLDDLSLSELYQLLQANPGMMRRPVVMDGKRLVVGYNEEEIRAFLPREVRRVEMQKLQEAITQDEQLA